LGLYLLYDIYARTSLGQYDLFWYTSGNKYKYNNNNKQAHVSFLQSTDTPHKAPLHQYWFYRGSPQWQLCLFAMTALLTLQFTLGCGWWPSFRTQSSSSSSYHSGGLRTALLLVFVTAMQNRNMHMHDGSDAFLRHLLLWSCFLPVHAHWTWGRPQQPTQRLQQNQHEVSGLACLGLTTQILRMYWGTVFHRTFDIYHSLSELLQAEWISGTAVHYVLSGSFAVRDNIVVTTIRSSRRLSQTMTVVGMLVETIAPAVCWMGGTTTTTMRLWGAIILALLHVGLLVCLRLPNWQWLGLLTQVVWLPGAFWDRVGSTTRIKRLLLSSSSSLATTTTTATKTRQQHVYKKTDGDAPTTPVTKDDTSASSTAVQKDDTSATVSTRTIITTSNHHHQQHPVSRFLQLFFLIYMIYNFCGNRGWIPKHDHGDIGEGLRLSQYWVMFNRVGDTCNNKLLTGVLNDHFESSSSTSNTRRVDLFQFIQSKRLVPQVPDDFVIQDMSSRYPSARWERALYNWDAATASGGATQHDHARVERFCQALCVLVNKDLRRWGQLPQSQLQQLVSVEMRVQHLKILPPGSPTRYASKRHRPDTVTLVVCDPYPSLARQPLMDPSPL
jgi:hypothetical protein